MKTSFPGEPGVVDYVRKTIQERGPATFAWLMEQALYHPQHGYYSSGRCSIGRQGDYYTNVSVGPVFGRLLAAQFAEMWNALDRPAPFTIVEQGAHDGAFARDVLESARQDHPDFFEGVRYEIVEPFPILKARQAETLSSFAKKVRWSSSLAELQPFHGVHFSNELLDAFPLHVVRWTGTEWLEQHVTERDERLVFVNAPLSHPALAERLGEIPLPLPAGYETEINLLALDWIATISSKLTQGFVLTIDYGFPHREFFAPHRSNGTLRSYANHRMLPSALTGIGHTDITAHVEWTSLVERAEAIGMRVVGFADQHHFITGLLAGESGDAFGPESDAKTRRALQTLLHPNLFGINFQFLALSKGVESSPALAGFRFARNARDVLGLS